MKICLKCKRPCSNDTLAKCSECNGELIQYSEEKYKYFLNNQKQSKSKYISREERMCQDIHTIKKYFAFIYRTIYCCLYIQFFHDDRIITIMSNSESDKNYYSVL